MRNCSPIQFIVHNFFILLILIFSFLLLPYRSVQAITVRAIGIQPNTPEYGKEFNCLFDVDVTEYDLSCGLLPVNAPDGTLPWDICPKREGTHFGRQAVGPPTATYGCIADASTKVPGPGTYKIVAWHFFSDGAKGEVLRSAIISIVPPQPTATLKLPTPIIYITDIPIAQSKTQETITTPATKSKVKVTPSYFEMGSKDALNNVPTKTLVSSFPSILFPPLPRITIQPLQILAELVVLKVQSIWRAFSTEAAF